MGTVAQLLRDAYERRKASGGFSMKKLRNDSGVATERSNLRRKLYGNVALNPEEARQLASVLGVRITKTMIARDMLAGHMTAPKKFDRSPDVLARRREKMLATRALRRAERAAPSAQSSTAA